MGRNVQRQGKTMSGRLGFVAVLFSTGMALSSVSRGEVVAVETPVITPAVEAVALATIDGPLTFGHISSQVAEELATLAPFGAGNRKPVFHTSAVQIVDGPRKLKDRHLKMSFRQDGRVFRAIQWNAAEREALMAEKKGGVELAFSLENNEFQGQNYLELRVEDFH